MLLVERIQSSVAKCFNVLYLFNDNFVSPPGIAMPPAGLCFYRCFFLKPPLSFDNGGGQWMKWMN